MKKLIFLFSLTLLFSFCQNKNSDADKKQEEQKAEEKITMHFSTVEQQGQKYCDDESNIACAKSLAKYPVAQGTPTPALSKINEKIKYAVATTFVGEKELNDSMSVGKAIGMYFKDFEKEVKENEGAGYLAHFVNETTVDIIYQTKEQVSMQLFNYNYAGGAHPNNYTRVFNFDKKTGNLITVNDIVKDKTALSNLLGKMAKAYYKKDESMSYEEAGFYIEGEEFPITDEMAILKDSLFFEYSPYQVAPYVMGGMTLKVAKEDIKDFLK